MQQSLSNLALTYYENIVAYFQAKDLNGFRSSGNKLLELILDMELITASQPNFLLGEWTNSARASEF